MTTAQVRDVTGFRRLGIGRNFASIAIHFTFFSLLVLLVSSTRPALCQSGTVSETIELPSGEKVLGFGAVSYVKLRRGTSMNLRYQLSIHPDGCFVSQDNDSAGWRAVTMQLNGEMPFLTKMQPAWQVSKRTLIKNVAIENCSSLVELRMKITAPKDTPLGPQKLRGLVTWQAVNSNGVLPAQTTSFEIPIEVVHHGDRSAKYNDSYGPHMGADLLWRIPTFPFVLGYCAIVGGDCPD